MVDIAKWATLERFSGVNNVDVATRLPALLLGQEYVFPLQQANNVDIDNTFQIKSRPGFDDVLSGSDIHSLWSNNMDCFFVDGNTFKRLFADYSVSSLRSDLTSGAKMSYALWNDKIYYTNSYEIGYVKGNTSNLLIDPILEFKAPLPAGQFIAYYRARLYVARDKVLYISDSLCDYYDKRSGYKQFANKITLLRPVDDGIYVGDDRVYWLKGTAPDDFEREEVYPHKPIPYTDVQVNGQAIGDGKKGNVAMWTGENGICIGNNSGAVENITEGRYTFTPTGQGAGYIRDDNNVRHYVNSLY